MRYLTNNLKIKNVIIVLTLIFLIAFVNITYAGEKQSKTNDIESNKDALLILNKTREGIGRNIRSLTQKVDDFLFKDREYGLELKDEIKLRFELLKEEGKDPEFKNRLNIYLSFPFLAIVINNYKTDDLPSSELSGEENEISTGISHYLLKLRKFILSIGYGVTIHNRKAVLYSRLRLLKHSIKIKNWNATLHQSIFWYSDVGSGELTQIDFNRPISEKMLFRATSAGLYSETSRGFELEQSFILSYDLIKKERIIFGRASGFGHTEPESDIDRYKTDIVYRAQLINPWLYFDIAPQMEFPANDNFKGIPGIRFGIDSIF